MSEIRCCRGCDAMSLVPVLDLGEVPLADGFVAPEMAAEVDRRYPLVVAICADCRLVQLTHTVPREVLFCADYPYYSAYSESWLRHVRIEAERHCTDLALGSDSRVVEIASNDGYFLQYFVARGIPCLGVDPAAGPAAAARRRGVRTREAFFDADLARELAAGGWRADLVLANNVLAHVSDLHGFVSGIATLLRPDGVAVLEFAYVGDFLENNAFDTLYHEHLCVFSLFAACRLFDRHGLVITAVERLSTHAGSLRVHVRHRGAAVDESVVKLLATEQATGVLDARVFANLQTRVRDHCDRLREILHDRVMNGRRMAAYGAAAKGTMLLNHANLGTDIIEYVVDRNPHKHGLLVPGVRVPIINPEVLRERPPDDLLILPWNLKTEIVAQQAWFAQSGGRFIVPLPRIEVLP